MRTVLGSCRIIGTALLLFQAVAWGADSETFVHYEYVDRASRLVAFRMLIPKGWRTEGGITWSANPALPAQSRFRFRDPTSRAELNLFPTKSFFWTSNGLFLSTNPPGTLRFGTLVARPVDLGTALHRTIIPEIRPGVRGLEVAREEKVPELAELAKGRPVAGVRASAEAGKVRLTYQEDGKAIEEELYAVVSQFVTDLPGSMRSGGYFIDYWYVDFIFSCRAEKGTLDVRSRTFKTMLHSLKIDPRWFAKVVNVKETMAQQYIKGIKAIGRMGETVARAGTQMREENQRDWERRQEAKDRLARNFSDNIRGVDRFYDPHAEKEVELPSGYGMAWANNLGEYIVTSDPNLNPNVGSNLHWEPMKTVR